MQCGRVSITEVLKEKVHYMDKDLFFHCEGKFSLLFDNINGQAKYHQLFTPVLRI